MPLHICMTDPPVRFPQQHYFGSVRVFLFTVHVFLFLDDLMEFLHLVFGLGEVVDAYSVVVQIASSSPVCFHCSTGTMHA
jgi:hypothetical protein